MQHDEAWELLLLSYVDESLEPGERAAVEAHLVRCAACREAVAAVRSSLGLADPATPVVTPAAAFLAGVERRAERAGLASQPEPPQRQRHWWAALLDQEQTEPVRWFLFALPALGALSFPGPRSVAVAAFALALGALLEYFLLTREAGACDPD